MVSTGVGTRNLPQVPSTDRIGQDWLIHTSVGGVCLCETVPCPVDWCRVTGLRVKATESTLNFIADNHVQ